MEVAGIIVSRQSDDVLYGQGGRGQQKSRLVQTLHLQELFKGMAGMFLDDFADGVSRDMKLPGDLLQGCRKVVMVDILQDGKYQVLFVLAGIIHIDPVRMVQKMEEKKPHGRLVDIAPVRLAVHQRPDQVFRQIFYRKNIDGLEMKIRSHVFIRFQGADKKVPQSVFLLQHNEDAVKKFRKDNKIHGDIVHSCREDFVGSIRIQQEQFARIQGKAGSAVEDVGGGSAAHINHFNIIMLVGREMYETGMGADIDQLPRCKHFPAVHHKIGSVGI